MRPIALVLTLAALASGAAARAEVEEAPFGVKLQNQVPPGQRPSITVTAAQPVRALKGTLTRDDGRGFPLAHGPLKPGQSATMPFGDGKAGRARWKGTLSAELEGGRRYATELTFETAALAELRVTYRRDRLDLEAGLLEVQLSRPAGRAELRVVGDDGALLAEASAEWKGEPPGTWLPVRWTPRPGNVLRLELRVTAQDGAGALVRLFPWSVSIPHEEVIFETGKAEVRPIEAAKLDASYQKIIDAVARARKVEPGAKVRLFVAGHTDTVGKAEDNKRLSLDRARAIARWFKDRGLPLPIAFAGFGEEALRVKTPDDTEEERNRRVDYIVALEEPQVARGVAARWMVAP